MFLTLRVVLIALLAMVSVGCATSNAIPLKPEATARIQSTLAHVAIPQHEIYAAVARSNVANSAYQAGLVGVLIGAAIDASVESSRASKASIMIEPLRKNLVDFDFRAEFDKYFRNAVAGMPWLKINQIEVTGKPYSEDDHKQMLADNSYDSLLVLAVDYQLSTDYRSLVVSGTATFWQRGLEVPQYFGEYRYLSAPVSRKSGETAVKAWAENDGKLLRAAMHEGINETIRMLKLDFVSKAVAEPEDAPLAETGKLRIVSIKASQGAYSGGVTTSRVEELANKVLSKENDRIVFIAKSAKRYTYPGHIYSTTTRQHFELPVESTSVKLSAETP